MGLPGHPIVELRSSGVNESLRWFVTLTCAASAGVHAALVPEHYEERASLGSAFALSVVVLAAAGLWLRMDMSVAPFVAAVLLGVAGSYLLSRTTGLPVLVPEPEPVDSLGVLTTLAEVVAALAALCLPRPGKEAS